LVRWRWSRVGCKECGAAGSVNIVPNGDDREGHAMPFTVVEKNDVGALTSERRQRGPDRGQDAEADHGKS